MISTFNMDRLVIETILADADSVALVDTQSSKPCICLGFDSGSMDQVKHAFEAMKALTENDSVSLVICETLVTGIYDIEIVTAALDEPIRICNKVVEQQTLKDIREIMDKHPEVVLAVSGAEEDVQLKIDSATFKGSQL